MLIKFIKTQEDKFQIETFDIDIRRNRVWKVNSAGRGSYLRSLNDLILKDISKRRVVPE